MVDQFRSWFRENQALVAFLGAQGIAFMIGGASLIAYYVKMETRVMILETRGAEYTVERLGKIDERLTIIEQRQVRNEAQIIRIVDTLLKDQQERRKQ